MLETRSLLHLVAGHLKKVEELLDSTENAEDPDDRAAAATTVEQSATKLRRELQEKRKLQDQGVQTV